MSYVKFYLCKHCGNLVSIINDSRSPLTCCGEKMQELIPNTLEAATEKHIPKVTISGDTVAVKVGSIAHPMTQEHHIDFITLFTEHGEQRKNLSTNDEPTAGFQLNEDTPLAVYAYCNLHGLWKTDIDAGIEDEMICSAEFPSGCIKK